MLLETLRARLCLSILQLWYWYSCTKLSTKLCCKDLGLGLLYPLADKNGHRDPEKTYRIKQLYLQKTITNLNTSPNQLVPWSPGPLVPRTLGHLVRWPTPGPLVWFFGRLVPGECYPWLPGGRLGGDGDVSEECFEERIAFRGGRCHSNITYLVWAPWEYNIQVEGAIPR